MRMNKSAQEYPEHLNPFDDNYDGVLNHGEEAEEPTSSRHKYHTWSSKRGLLNTLTRGKVKEQTSSLEKPWVGGKGKLVRRLSFLKTAVERVSFRRKRGQEPSRSNSLHEDMSYRIISPKVKERLRLQALPGLARQEQTQANSADSPSSPELGGRLPLSTPLRTEDDHSYGKDNNYYIDSPDTIEHHNCSTNSNAAPVVRPRRHKKRPPPPPPPRTEPTTNLGLTNGVHNSERPEDTISASSSITQDLEKVLVNGDNDSLAEFEFDKEKLELHSPVDRLI